MHLVFTEDDLARAAASAAAAARTAERAVLEADREARIAEALDRIAATVAGFDTALEAHHRQCRDAAAVLAACAAEALAPATPKQLAARLAVTLVDECLGRLEPELPLTVEVAAELADALAARLDASPVVRQRTGRLAVETAADLAPGDARIVWPDGHAEWSAERLKAEALAVLERLTDPAPQSPSRKSPDATEEPA